MKIARIGENEFPDAMELVWRVFLKYNAPSYSAEGIHNFKKFLGDEKLYELFCNGDYVIFACFDEDTICGVISLRNESHISLLFVKDEYQGTGVATALFSHLCSYCRSRGETDFITVNSSPYAVEYYRQLGFEPTDLMQTSDGITYTPMRYELLS